MGNLKDIIDLDYLLDQDEDFINDTGSDSFSEKYKIISDRDRKIFSEIEDAGEISEKSLLLKWLNIRRQEFSNKKEGLFLLPGTAFYFFWKWSIKVILIAGFVMGFGTAYSFLAYHGVKPVNITLFFILFIFFPFLIFFFSIFFLCLGALKKILSKSSDSSWADHGLVLSISVRVLPYIFRKWQSKSRLGDAFSAINRKKELYGPLFFWPAIIFSSLFALGFSSGTLGGTFFRVLTSDMAFGWQSTISASDLLVHTIVSKLSTPWSWLLPGTIPDQIQIEGSRIILKQGIKALSTEHLTAWWPFLCMGIIFYSILPRVFMLIMAAFFEKRRLNKFDFQQPGFRKLIIRMKSPLMDVSSRKTVENLPEAKQPPVELEKVSSLKKDREEIIKGLKSLASLMIPAGIFNEKERENIKKRIKKHLLFDCCNQFEISFDLENDLIIINNLLSDIQDNIIILQEIWQPPIRERLYYYSELASSVFKDKTIWIILLPYSSERENNGEITDFDLWLKSIERLNCQNIAVERAVW
ncbi:MAG: hypothetical protein CSA18_01695 [Deltaproteobacteria bacterium]|nr:MAG: hypothetical protein CSA18_01695 [Deltaproteobacteria bacterium]